MKLGSNKMAHLKAIIFFNRMEKTLKLYLYIAKTLVIWYLSVQLIYASRLAINSINKQ